MELKCDTCRAAIHHKVSSNCTFMELKFIVSIILYFNHFSSNCTFMELKYVTLKGSADGGLVLIVPLWN